MTDFGSPNPHYTRPPAGPPRRKMSGLVIVGIIAAVIVVLCGAFAIIGTLASSTDPKPSNVFGNRDASGLGSPAPYDTSTPTTAAPAGPKTTITEGDWVVGTDVAPGTYRTAEAVSGMCYWGIYRAGTNKGDIVQNDIVTGGRPTVTLKAGQEFSSTGCGTWTKTA